MTEERKLCRVLDSDLKNWPPKELHLPRNNNIQNHQGCYYCCRPIKQHPWTFGSNLKPVAELKISKNFKPRYLDGVILDHPIYHQGKDRIDSMKENENSFYNNQW